MKQKIKDYSFESAQYHYYVVEKIKKAIDSVERGHIVTHEEVVNYFNQKIEKLKNKPERGL